MERTGGGVTEAQVEEESEVEEATWAMDRMTIWPLKPGTSTMPKAVETKSKQGPVKRPAVDKGRAIGLGATGSRAEAEGTSAEDTPGVAGGEGEGRNKGVPETCDMKKRKEQKKMMLG